MKKVRNIVIIGIVLYLVIGSMYRNFLEKMTTRYELEPEQMKQERQDIFEASINAVGKEEYWKIYNKATETIKKRIDKGLVFYNAYRYDPWQLDSVILFSNEKNSCNLFILSQTTNPEFMMDLITCLYGIKIEEDWCFFKTEASFFDRNGYQRMRKIPPTFDEMKQIVTDFNHWESNRSYNTFSSYDKMFNSFVYDKLEQVGLSRNQWKEGKINKDSIYLVINQKIDSGEIW